MIYHVGRHAVRWENEVRRRCKNCSGCEGWLVGQCTGEYMLNVSSIADVLKDVHVLEDCQLMVPRAELARLHGADAGLIGADDEVAEMLASLAWQLVAERRK